MYRNFLRHKLTQVTYVKAYNLTNNNSYFTLGLITGAVPQILQLQAQVTVSLG